jgi:hypothetical protein
MSWLPISPRPFRLSGGAQQAKQSPGPPMKIRPIKVRTDSAMREPAQVVGELKATTVQSLSIRQIKLNQRNSRTHSAKQIRQIANSIKAFGFTNPLLITEDGTLVAGEGRSRQHSYSASPKCRSLC